MNPPNEHCLKRVPRNFLMAGNCTFTLVSDALEHRTYKIDRSDPQPKKDRPGEVWPEAWWVALLTGPDNTSNYRSFGKVDPATGRINILQKTGMTEQTEAVALVQIVLDAAFADADLPEGLWLQTPSRCGRCGRPLTATNNPYFPWLGPECGTKG